MSMVYVLACNALQHAIFVVTLGFTSADSILRPALLPLLLALTLYVLPFNDTISNPVAHGLFNFNAVGLFFQYLDCACISRWSFSAGGPTSKAGGYRNVRIEPREDVKRASTSYDVLHRLRFGTSLATTWRAAGTPWQVKGTPRFKRVPNRVRFVIGTVLWLAFDLLTLDAMSLPRGDGKEANVVNFAWDRVRLLSRIHEVSAEEMTRRTEAVLWFWFRTYFTLQALHRALAIVGVVTGVKDVHRWPPTFGPLGQTYTLRRFWGVFWHQTLRQKCGSPAYCITYSALRLKKGGLIARYAHLLLSFVVSAIIHLMAEEYPHGIEWHRSGTVRFFVTQAFGILLEDVVQAAFGSNTASEPPLWTKVVGWVWVGAFTFWSSPSHFYPRIQVLDTSEGGVPPVGILRPLVERSAAGSRK